MNRHRYGRIDWTRPLGRKRPDPAALTTRFASKDTVDRVRRFHRSLPGFAPTPLVRLAHLADRLGLGGIYVKDESQRCGLNAFKVLGASYALSTVLAQRCGIEPDRVIFDQLTTPANRTFCAQTTCVTATDGNHGRAVAWSARQLGCRAHVYMPRGSSAARLAAIRDSGAAADIIDGNYDDAVAFAARQADRNGWLLIQDTGWTGYSAIPQRIMEGYTTLIDEALEQMAPQLPSHVLLQCGVGSYAAAICAYLVERFGNRRPRVMVVEPTLADCFYRSAAAGTGTAQRLEGDLATIMAGLACGTPSPLAWPILNDHAYGFIRCDDRITALGMRVLGNPLPGDRAVISGESGAVGLGLVYALQQDPAYRDISAEIGLDKNAQVLLISTEGATDPDMYRRIVWEGYGGKNSAQDESKNGDMESEGLFTKGEP